MEPIPNLYHFWRGCVAMWWRNKYFVWFTIPWSIFSLVTLFAFPDLESTQFWKDYKWWAVIGTGIVSIAPLFLWAPHRLVARAGFPMSRKLIGQIVIVALTVGGILGIGLFPYKVIPSIEDDLLRYLAWLLFYVVVVAFAVIIGLMPFFGQTKRLEAKTVEYDGTKALREREAERNGHEKDYIFPYIRQINVSAMLRNSADYFDMTLCFPNSVIYPRTLEITGVVNIAGAGESQRLETERISWQAQANICQSWKVRLDSTILALFKGELDRQKKLEVSVKLWDINDKDHYYWQTEQLTIRPIE